MATVTHHWMDRGVHFIPGRLRLPFAALLHNPVRAGNLEAVIREWPGVEFVRAEARTGRLLLHYNPQRLTLSALEAKLRALEFAPDPPRPLPPLPPGPNPWLTTATAIVAVSGLLGTVLKRRARGASTFSHTTSAFDLGAVVAIVAGYPDLRKGVKHLVERRQVSGDLLLGAVTYLSLLVRESVVGLTVLTLTSLYNLMYVRTLARVKSQVKQLMPDELAKHWHTGHHTVMNPPDHPELEQAEPSVRYASRLAPWAFGAAIAASLISRSPRRGLATLLAACPSAELLSDPLPYASVAAAAADRGIFVKDFAAVRVAGRVQRVLLRPTLEEVQGLQQAGVVVAVVGHDETDAPALAVADLAIVLTQPCPKHPLPAHVLLDRNEPGNLEWFLRESDHARHIAVGNHVWARGLGLIGLALAATGILTPFGAAMYQNLTGLGVVLFSSRLLPRRLIYRPDRHECRFPQPASQPPATPAESPQPRLPATTG